MSSLDAEVILKVAVVGGRGAGKTCVIRRFLHNHFNQAVGPTLVVEEHLRSLPSYQLGNASICLSWWDVGGAEYAGAVLPLLFARVSAVVFVVDPFDAASLADLDRWRAAAHRYVPPKEVPMMLLATKADLAPRRHRVVSDAVLARYCEQAGLGGGFAHVTAMSGRTVHEAIERLESLILSNESSRVTRWRMAPPADTTDADVRACAVPGSGIVYDLPAPSPEDGGRQPLHLPAAVLERAAAHPHAASLADALLARLRDGGEGTRGAEQQELETGVRELLEWSEQIEAAEADR